MTPRLDSILDRVHDIEKYDRLARRNYGLSDNKGGSGSLDLNVLAGRGGRVIIGITSDNESDIKSPGVEVEAFTGNLEEP